MSGVFEEFISNAREVMIGLKDHREKSNAATYSMVEAGMGALAVFVMQEPSFLSQQEKLSKGTTLHNFKTLYGCDKIPSTAQSRNILDDAETEEFDVLYHKELASLESRGGLEGFKCLGGILIALDGTQHHSSSKIHCCNCSLRVHANGKTTYHHAVLCASIVAPGIKEAIPLAPEFITPQDGNEKQDCEMVAAKRWISTHQESYKHLKPTILGDDLFSRQPMCALILNAGFNFILTCKRDSHKITYEYLSGVELEESSCSTNVRGKKYTYKYRFMNGVPIKDGKDAINVNWVEVTEIIRRNGKQSYQGAFVTSHTITAKNVHEIAMAGRSRWRIENEHNNTLKTKGYRFEHNYGHGKRNLSTVLTTLALLAFLCHTIMSLTDELYAKARELNGSRINFFNMIRAFTSILVFMSWSKLMLFMVEPPNIPASATSS